MMVVMFFTMMSKKSHYNTWNSQIKLRIVYTVEHTDEVYNVRTQKIVNKHFINLPMIENILNKNLKFLTCRDW